MKSPSDTTLYSPAVRRVTEEDSVEQNMVNKYVNQCNQINSADPGEVDKINTILNKIRLDFEGKKKNNEESNNNEEPQPSTSSFGLKSEQEKLAEARAAAEERILQAERYKASLQIPQQGKEISLLARYMDDDDDFFHLTCHIDSTTREKIKRGEFVELVKLLIKPEHQKFGNEGRMQLVYRNGESFFVPHENNYKIDGIRKWEQAFRNYAAIYCEANPSRSVEILQYIDVINSAAPTFCWENVAKYDFIFRHLQAKKPHRSWAKTYTQMWNLTLNEPLRRANFDNNFQRNQNNSNKRKSSDNTCWRFNKGHCPFGKNCRFEHKCTYCWSTNHGNSRCNRRSSSKNESKPESRSSRHQSNSNAGKHDHDVSHDHETSK